MDKSKLICEKFICYRKADFLYKVQNLGLSKSVVLDYLLAATKTDKLHTVFEVLSNTKKSKYLDYTARVCFYLNVLKIHYEIKTVNDSGYRKDTYIYILTEIRD